ncbi:MAG: hypothetical protein WCE21_04095 [Candidatus Babeliales bacterium]
MHRISYSLKTMLFVLLLSHSFDLISSEHTQTDAQRAAAQEQEMNRVLAAINRAITPENIRRVVRNDQQTALLGLSNATKPLVKSRHYKKLLLKKQLRLSYEKKIATINK